MPANNSAPHYLPSVSCFSPLFFSYLPGETYQQFSWTQKVATGGNSNLLFPKISLIVNILSTLPLVEQINNSTASWVMGYVCMLPWFLEEDGQMPTECCEGISGNLRKPDLVQCPEKGGPGGWAMQGGMVGPFWAWAGRQTCKVLENRKKCHWNANPWRSGKGLAVDWKSGPGTTQLFTSSKLKPYGRCSCHSKHIGQSNPSDRPVSQRGGRFFRLWRGLFHLVAEPAWVVCPAILWCQLLCVVRRNQESSEVATWWAQGHCQVLGGARGWASGALVLDLFRVYMGSSCHVPPPSLCKVPCGPNHTLYPEVGSQ